MIGMRRYIGYAEALSALYPKAQWAIRNNSYDELDWMEQEIEKPAKEVLDAKIAELEVDEPLRVVREVRNHLLHQCDWTQGHDIRALRGWEWCVAWDEYRQALRDITKTNPNPTVDQLGVISNVVWPQPPLP
jgi:hypothetical protein